MRWLSIACLLACVVLPAFAAAPATSPAVQKLIDQLGDDDEDTRKAAAKQLEALDEDVVPILRRAARTHPDIDTRLRAGVIAAAINKKLTGELKVYQASNWVCRCLVTPDGKKVVSTGDYLRIYDLETGKKLVETGAGANWALSVSRDGKHVLCSNGDRSARLYEVETGKEVHKFVKHTHEVWVASLSPDGKIAVTGGFDRAVHV